MDIETENYYFKRLSEKDEGLINRLIKKVLLALYNE
jgi:hypothetical protein